MRVHPEIRGRPLFRVREQDFLDAVAARHPGMHRDAAISAELHRNLRVYLLGHPVAFARMTAAKVWRMWAFPFRGHVPPRARGPRSGCTACSSRSRWPGCSRALVRRRAPLLGIALLAIGVTTAVDVAFVAEARHAFRLMPALLAAGAAGWALLGGGEPRPSEPSER